MTQSNMGSRTRKTRKFALLLALTPFHFKSYTYPTPSALRTMKANIAILAGIATCAPIVAGSFSCYCIVDDTSNAGAPVIVAINPCQQAGGTLCHNSAGNYNYCITGSTWTDDQCRSWAGGLNPSNEMVRATCVDYNGGGCPA
ncbi:hypothetical protein BS50DRAFT_595240 [Corynespora cassiicola Philippines]|uniref:Uncharacterized protein n=1 Tax=Corynespora cassiicola Philippines TaxID=1448308 RepID=A0A2T2N0X9_CORCC|nr:hypothetical protein BS50DRAFT_595238 [Corynespora cassiicola Philippines]PSN58700.1 hypothetical protein BS50DRAFT_595240 [Corynespora cassiicola Philippines]